MRIRHIIGDVDLNTSTFSWKSNSSDLVGEAGGNDLFLLAEHVIGVAPTTSQDWGGGRRCKGHFVVRWNFVLQ